MLQKYIAKWVVVIFLKGAFCNIIIQHRMFQKQTCGKKFTILNMEKKLQLKRECKHWQKQREKYQKLMEIYTHNLCSVLTYFSV